MLQLKNITKVYKTAGAEVHALRGVSLNFRANEFVSVLGASGCGKTTMLNIIGGLDHYTSGDLVINGKSTKDYKDHDWDVYRNHRIGFVFQSYNLIPHQTVLGNVEIALTIAGVSKSERRRRASEALKRVGLSEEMHKRPNQLSGGQMQRVAIARALVNNPEILLADEPTGALDTTTSVQIMELIREIAGERLVIMVTHNPELAQEYSSRIVRLQDGLVISDSNPYTEEEEREEIAKGNAQKQIPLEEASSRQEQSQGKSKIKQKKEKKEHSSMSFATALGLSARNLLTKKGRTALTSFAGSIGIISVCLVLALSNGFNGYILKTEEDMLSANPVQIMETTSDVEAIMSGMSEMSQPDITRLHDQVYVDSFLTNIAQGMQVSNNLSEEYLNYLEEMDEDYYETIMYGYGESLVDNLYTTATLSPIVADQTDKKETKNLSLSALKSAYVDKLGQMDTETNNQYANLVPLVSYLGEVVNKIPGTADMQDDRYLQYVQSQYDKVYGEWPKEKGDALLVIGPRNDVTDLTLVQLGLLEEDQFFSTLYPEWEMDYEPYLSFEKIAQQKYTLYYNDAIYTRNTSVSPLAPQAFNYASELPSLDVKDGNGVEVRIAGIVQLKEGRSYGCLKNGLNLTEALVNEYVQKNVQSEVSKYVNGLTDSNAMLFATNNPTLQMLTYQEQMAGGVNGTYMATKRSLGAVDTISEIFIYTEDFEMKEDLLSYLGEWNDTHGTEEQVKWSDPVGTLMSMVETILNAITYVLVAFTSISLVVSSVMIGIITYVSVVERVKEIGVLRSLGARKRDIRNLFNAETFIIGLSSGVIGVGVTYLISLGVNAILGALTGISTLASLPFTSALIMIGVSVTLTLISGLIPAGAAAKKDPVIALRTE